MKHKYLILSIFLLFIIALISYKLIISKDSTAKVVLVNENNQIDNLKKLAVNYFEDLQRLELDYFEQDQLKKDSMIDFAINYNFMYNREQSVTDHNYIKSEIVNNTILSFFNIHKNDFESMDYTNKPIKYKNTQYYKFPDYYYEATILNISSFITKVNYIDGDIYDIYLTDYVTFPDNQEFVFANIKSIIKYNDKKGIYQLIEYKEIEKIEGWR